MDPEESAGEFPWHSSSQEAFAEVEASRLYKRWGSKPISLMPLQSGISSCNAQEIR
jgi:hypothetical protein